MAELTEDCPVGAQPLHFMHDEFRETKAQDRNLVRIPQSDSATTQAWKKQHPIVYILGDCEHLVPEFIQKSVAQILKIDQKISTMSATQFEFYRDSH